MGIKENIIEAHGLNDGKDEDRYEQAVIFSKELDYSIVKCFRALVSLEKKELIILSE